MQKTIILTAVVAVVLSSFITSLVWFKQTQQSMRSKVVGNADWETYISQHGFSFRYPADYQVVEREHWENKEGSTNGWSVTIYKVNVKGGPSGTPYMVINVWPQSRRAEFGLWEGLRWDHFENVMRSFTFSLPLQNDATPAVPADERFQITNIANTITVAGISDHTGSPITAVFPVYAYNCDVAKIENGFPVYFKIDFFAAKDKKNAPTILLGTTPGGSAGSGECDLLENESSLKSKLAPGNYRIWAVRYIDGKPDKRTAEVRISIVGS